MINQVLACPKCGNMVRVIPPADLKLDDETIPSLPPQVNRPEDSPAESSDQDTSSLSRFEDIDELINRESKRTATPIVPEPPRKARRNSQSTATSQPTSPASSVDPETTSAPMLPDQNWTSNETKNRQKLTLAVVAGLGIVLLTIGGITAIVVNSSKPNLAQTKTSENENNQVEKKGGTDETDTAVTKVGSDQNDTDNDHSKSTDDTDVDSNPNSVEEPTKVDENPDSEDNTETGDSSKTDTNPPTDETPLVETPEVGNPLIDNPLPDREGFDDPLANLGGPRPKDPLLNSTIDSADRISTRLGELNDLLSNTGMSLSSIRDVADSSRISGVGRSKYFMEAPTHSLINLNQMLNNRLSGVRYQDTDFQKFLDELSNLTGAPLSLHVESMRAAGLPIRGKVDLFEKDIDVSTCLDNVLDPLQLKKEVFATENQIVIVAKDWEKLVEKSFELPHLSDSSPEGLANFVRRVRGMFAEQAWTEETLIEMKEEKLFVKQVPQVQYQIGRLIEKLKAAQAVNKNPADALGLATLQSEWAQSKNAREAKLNFKPGLDLRLRRFLDRVEEQAKVKILVDWNSLSQQGWWPNTVITGEFSEPNLQETLYQVSRAMNCNYRALDENTFELLASQEADQRPELQVYRVQELLNANLTSEVLMETLSRTFQRESNLLQMGFDDDSLSVVVIAPQTLQIQIEAVIDRFRAGS